MDGMMKFFQLPVPVMGKRRHVMENHKIIVSANQKLGIAWPITAMVSATRSTRLLGRMAATTPSGMERMRANPKAQAPSNMVVGKRSNMTLATSDLR